tara:strand:- start:1019 stop:1228 length:210 start_codon:yes stop_codon:yes gene_type:complete
MTYKLINPNKAIHPHRKKMTDDDWDRLNRVIVGKEKEDCTLEELAAFTDYLHDRIAAKKQTHYGTTVLQ